MNILPGTAIATRFFYGAIQKKKRDLLLLINSSRDASSFHVFSF